MLNLSVSQALIAHDDDFRWEVRLDNELMGYIHPVFVVAGDGAGSIWTEETGEFQIGHDTPGRGWDGVWAERYADPFAAAAVVVATVAEALGITLSA